MIRIVELGANHLVDLVPVAAERHAKPETEKLV